jgi:hypothetical protein
MPVDLIGSLGVMGLLFCVEQPVIIISNTIIKHSPPFIFFILKPPRKIFSFLSGANVVVSHHFPTSIRPA